MKHLLMNLGLVIMYVYCFADIYGVQKRLLLRGQYLFPQTKKEKETNQELHIRPPTHRMFHGAGQPGPTHGSAATPVLPGGPELSHSQFLR